jgi:hypothetical protein
MPVQSRRWSRMVGTSTIGVAAAATLAIGFAGCSDRDETYGLQPLPSTTSSPPTPTEPVLNPEQRAVADAVTRYDSTIGEISGGAPIDMNKLKGVALAPWATAMGRNLFQLKALKQHTTGASNSRVISVSISKNTAIFVDCTDSRKLSVVSTASTPTTVGKGKGPAIDKVFLVRVSNKWIVKSIENGGKC